MAAALDKLPRVEGSGAGQVFLAPETARLFAEAEKIAEKAGDSFVTVERLLLALALMKGTAAAKALADAGVNAAEPQPRHRRGAQGPHSRQRQRRGGL